MGNNNKILSVFDFDHTLAKVDSYVYVRRKGKVIKKLTPATYAGYKLSKGEEFDYIDFNRPLKNPKLIRKNFKILVKQLDKARRSPRGSRKVTILTARGLSLPVSNFFKTLGLKPYVVALGSGDPKDKADWIEKQINKPNGYNVVYFMDDSIKNIKAINKMLEKYPKVESIIKLIK